MKIKTQDLSYKVNTHYSSKSKNDRHNHSGDRVDHQMNRKARANFKHLKVTLAQSDWE